MPIPLPNLDDRRWADLVEQGRALVPLYAPEWTDHNASDPGITLMELFAFVTEMDLYRLNRIPDAHKRKMLTLLGVRPTPPHPARGAIELRHKAPTATVRLPAGTQFLGSALDNTSIPFRSVAEIDVSQARLAALQWRDTTGFHNVTAAWERQEAFFLFGEQPLPGAELYLGFDAALPKTAWTNLYLSFAGPRTGRDERKRILEEANSPSLPAHHSARLAWEYLTASGWVGLDSNDDTRSLSLDGVLQIRPDGDAVAAAEGKIPRALFYVRCRLASGAFDAQPKAARVLMNAVEIEQAAPLWQSWPIAKGALKTGSASPGDRVPVRFELKGGEIASLAFGASASDDPSFSVLAYVPDSPSSAGLLTLEATVARGDQEPNQTIVLPRRPVAESGFSLYELDSTSWRKWEPVDDFTASGRASAHYLLHPTVGEIECGDGDRGRTFAAGSLLLSTGDSTLGAAGSARVFGLADTPHNRALVTDPGASTIVIGEQITPDGGKDAEALSHAIGRAIELRESRLRAITPEDFDSIALETPGTHIARATTRPNLYPGFTCIHAPGVVTVIVVPDMPGPRPFPSAGLIAAVSARMERRRTIGTRVMVVGPGYLEVAVRARVQSLNGTDKASLRQKVAAALNALFHPLHGGPEGGGWPFGRDVYRSEVLQAIDETQGVDHVLSLELLAEGCAPTCGNLCLPPIYLVAAGTHEIEVV